MNDSDYLDVILGYRNKLDYRVFLKGNLSIITYKTKGDQTQHSSTNDKNS